MELETEDQFYPSRFEVQDISDQDVDHIRLSRTKNPNLAVHLLLDTRIPEHLIANIQPMFI
ncbi:unnamed protein product [Clonostachys rhizophaga]|uniref:Uncharacterized protein n=1 Tax=Clonostachys rhizophaga TaxID=160324 RepID=A0A9N9VG77_9HYPO|nr:unnamed protein product [Clonostachys rhizophaga]